MSKKTLVIVGILIFMGVIATWVYVLVNGPTAANNGNSFTEFGAGDDSNYVPSPEVRDHY